jgi:hypothetical protein
MKSTKENRLMRSYFPSFVKAKHILWYVRHITISFARLTSRLQSGTSDDVGVIPLAVSGVFEAIEQVCSNRIHSCDRDTELLSISNRTQEDNIFCEFPT